MADYAKYRDSVQISNVEMTEVLSEIFPAFSKIQASMINAPAKYGLCLTPEAETYLVNIFGYGDGLNVKIKKGRQVKRNKSNRMAVRLDDPTYDMVKEKMAQMGLKNAQDFLELAIKNITGGINEEG